MSLVQNSLLSLAYGAIARLRNVCAAFLFLVVPSVAQDQPVIVALGDSLTAGYGLAPEDGLTVQLQAWLQANGHAARVQNAGVSGDTTAGGMARVGWALGPDADAVIVILGGNDMLRGIDPASSRTNIAAILTETRERALPVLLVGMQAPGNFGPDYKAQFDAIYPELAQEFGSVYAPSFFAGLAGLGADPADPSTYAAYLQADGIHPNAEGVRAIVDGLGPKVVELLARVGE